MQIIFISVGKTSEKWVSDACSTYVKRLGKYVRFQWHETTDIKSLPPDEMKLREFAAIKKYIEQGDHVVLLDERGAAYSSVGFSEFITRKQLENRKRLVFVLGGAHGFHEDAYSMANETLRLSDMTFPHQMVRIIFLEQLYRAFTIINREPYHH
ncbi:MAG: 23S rRNA (pseudouridine(1915)-N(3))-methyltransferase RlmH [Chitinophagales bacterium]|nr:23S rRNA (pseudouridine(1915)-N(3))-methyltransferase RlmH [Chitinophagales bacterium]